MKSEGAIMLHLWLCCASIVNEEQYKAMNPVATENAGKKHEKPEESRIVLFEYKGG